MNTGRMLASCAAVLWLASCHGNSGDSATAPVSLPQTKAATALKPGPTVGELTAGMVEAVPVGKSTVPVAVKFDLPTRPMVDQPLEVVIALLPEVAASSATLQATGSDGLKLSAASAGPVAIQSIEPAQAYRFKLTLTPTAEGVQLLGLSVALNRDESTDTRTFSLPIIVAGAGDTNQR